MKRVLSEIIQFTLIAILIVLPFRLFIAQPFVVNGSSMVPTFQNGDYLIVDQLSYQFSEPERGSVVIFRYPNDTSKFFIKRIIGLPGETVSITEGEIRVSNEAQPDGFVVDSSYVTEIDLENFESTTLNDDEYFVMGDNRAGSSDSRAWGPLSEEFIVGRPFIQVLPITDLGIFPGNYTE